MPDVLDPISKIIGRQASFADQSQKAEQPHEKSVESILGRKPETAQFPDLMMSRFGVYANARKNGFEPEKAINLAREQAGTVKDRQQSLWEKTKNFVANVPVAPGKTAGDVGNDLARINQRLWNPELMTDEQWEKAKKDHGDWFAKYVTSPEAQAAWQRQPGIVGDLAKSDHLWKIGAGAAQHSLEFGQEMAMSPAQVALAVGTFGESSLVRAAYKASPGAVPAARTLAKLMQAQFISQMAEGTVQGAQETYEAVKKGDWQAAGGAAIDTLASAFMTHGAMSHEMAVEHVRGDLEKTAREMYGDVQGGFTRTFQSVFDKLDPFRQGEVIHRAVETSPYYKQVIDATNQADTHAKTQTREAHARRLNEYYKTAIDQSWNPNVSERTIRNLDRARIRDEANKRTKKTAEVKEQEEQMYRQRADEARQKVDKEDEEVRNGIRERRTGEGKEASEARQARVSQANSIREQRQEVAAQRQKIADAPLDIPTREVDAHEENGQVHYVGNYWGEDNRFGVVPQEEGRGNVIYRQTSRGTEWLGADGNFSETPDQLYTVPDPQTADAIAKLSSVSATADTMAEEEGSTPEQKQDAEKLSNLRRELIEGNLSASDAQRQAGIAEKINLGDEYQAAREGKLTGPFFEKNAAEFASGLEESIRAANEGGGGWEEEDIRAVVDGSLRIARKETENNLSHVHRAGDFIVSKRGVKWTMDSRGFLHPSDGGQPVPLLKNGLYTNQALQLGASGRIGYGNYTREQRRVLESRDRAVRQAVAEQQEEVRREILLASQREGLEPTPEILPREDAAVKAARGGKWLSRPPVSPETAAMRQIGKLVYNAPTGASSVIHRIAAAQGVSAEEVMRQSLANDPARAGSIEARVARLMPGDQISDDFRKDKPWVVEEKNGNLYLRSGSASPIPLNRLNPSDRVQQIVSRGEVKTESPEFSNFDIERIAYRAPHIVHAERLAAEVEERKSGAIKDPPPVTRRQVDVQAQSAKRRANAAADVATDAVVKALNPTTDSVEQAVDDVEKSTEAIKTAEDGYAQQAAAEARTEPEDIFPQRADVSIGLKGNSGVVIQNNREFPFHYELLPIPSIQTSHEWQGDKLVVNPEYPDAYQPRTISESQTRQIALWADKYDFRQYADKTFNGTAGPTIVDTGGRAVGGNTRLSIMRRHLKNLESIGDPELREASIAGFRSAMKEAAREVGIRRYPDDTENYAVFRVLDKAAGTTREAAELGRMFNKPVGVQITKNAKGISLSKSFDKPLLEDIGRRVDAHDGIIPAMNADPDFFMDVIRNRFGIVPEEEVDWFEEKGDDRAKYKVLNDSGREQFVKALLGTVIKNPSILSRIEGTTTYRSIERALGYIVKMEALPEFNITDKINEAVAAAAETKSTDPALSRFNDRWNATYRPDQQDLMGMESDLPPEPDRVVEALWRATQTGPRVLNDRLKAFLGEESTAGGWIFGEHRETPTEAFNRAFRKELKEVAFTRGGKDEISEADYAASLNNEPSGTEYELEEGGRGESSERRRPETQNLRKRIDQMSREEMRQALLTSRKTGLPNKVDFEEKNNAEYGGTPAPFVGMSDVDGLKAFNDTYGYDAGDKLLKAKADAIREAGVEAYHDKGDEFLYRAQQGTDLREKLDRAREILRNTPIEVVKNGEVIKYKGVDFSFGIGKDLAEAESQQKEAKAARTKAGERERGSFGGIKPIPQYADFEERSDDNELSIVEKTLIKSGYSEEQVRAMHHTEKARLYTELQKPKAAPEKDKARFVPPAGKMVPPPKPPTPEEMLRAQKEGKGFVTTGELKDFLAQNPATKEHATELIRTAQLMAEHVYDSDPPVGVDRKNALDWVLRERLAGIEAGESETKRGEYSDPNIDLGTGILKLHKASDPTTFIHEFAHVVFPLLSDEDLQAINSIGKRDEPKWDGTRKGLTPDVYRSMSEKLSHGLEKFLRDQNPKDFSSEVAKVLEKVKQIFRSVYLAFAKDPLSPYTLSSESVELFDKMFHVTGSDVPDVWRDEVKKARAEEKRLKKPEDTPHPLQKTARELGATSLKESFAGRIVDSIGDRIDPKKPTAVMIFKTENEAVTAYTGIVEGAGKINDAELIESPDGKFGIRINTATKPPRDILNQELPERHPGLQLEDLQKKMNSLPTYKLMERKLLQMQIDNLKNRIRADHGIEEKKPVDQPGVAKAALEEKKNGKTTDRVRENADGVSRPSQPKSVGGLPRPPKLGLSGHAAAGDKRGVVGRGPLAGEARGSLTAVAPVSLRPLPNERGTPVGTTEGQAFDQKAWTDILKRSGLPENAPPPTVSLARTTADKLKFPGQKQTVQLAMSALRQGDGFIDGRATGSGKTFTATAIIKEFREDNPNAKILYISKNRKLLKKTKTVASNYFGFEVGIETPKDPSVIGTYGVSYVGMMNDSIYKQIPWDLVVADESGEARNWFQPDNKQGKLLMEVMANSKKAVYQSATPFHSPMEYGYLEKLGLWPKGGFDQWIQQNFAHEKIGDRIVAKLDPVRQAKLRQQLIERGQMVSQAISYEGLSGHFGVVPVTDSMKRGLDRIREGFARAKTHLLKNGKKGMAEKAAAFEATYTKAFLERERLPQAIELGRKAAAQGWQVVFFSEHSAEDLFRRPRGADIDPSSYQELDDAMGGELSKIIPPFPDAYRELKGEFGERIGDYSGRGNTLAEREKALNEWLQGKTRMLYSTYAAGGIGVDMHDADFPDLGIKGGDKPRVFLFLGPPYSGVLLEQAMGRGWRFGVKSDAHLVFLASDSEPDVRLMTTKVGPRMKALRAAVLGEKDSLAQVMSSFSDEEKVRQRQDMLAYSEGDEEKVNAARFQVRSKSRTVGLQDWSAINFPSAETAKNKGMKYGEEVAGGDWSTLFQAKFGIHLPDEPGEGIAKETIDGIGNGLTSGQGLPEGVSVQNLEPADRDVVVGASAAVASGEAGIAVDRDKQAAARQSIQAQLNMPGDRNKWVLTWPRGAKVGVWKYLGDPEDLRPTEGEVPPPSPHNIKTWYVGNVMSQEMGIKGIARQAGVREIGNSIVRMNRSYQADRDLHYSQFALSASDIMRKNKLDPHDNRVMGEIFDVVEGKWSSADPAINKAANELADLMQMVNDDMAKGGVKVKTPSGQYIPYSEMTRDRRYMPHRIDWDAQVEDPLTGEKSSLREIMGRTFAEDKRARIIQSIANSSGMSTNEIVDYLSQHKPGTPVLSHVHRARVANFPIIRKDWGTMLGYFDQAAEAIAIEKNFGADREKLNKEIEKIPSYNGRATINSMFDGLLEPQDWTGATAKFYNAMIGYEALSKMTLSAVKVPYHLVHTPLSLGGRVTPVLKAVLHTVTNPRGVMENATYVGTVARQLNVGDLVGNAAEKSLAHTVFQKFLFNAFYKWGRAISGESARVWMEQHAFHEVKKGGTGAEHARRLLKETMLIGDQAVDQALAQNRWSPEDLAKAQTAFANFTMFSDNPLQMPGWARLQVTENTPGHQVTLHRALRLTYALQSFSLKTTSILREKLWDEVMVHHNYKPLAYFLAIYPIVGEALRGTSAGVKGAIQGGISGLSGGPRKEDAWDKYFGDLKDDVSHGAMGLLKRYIDNITFGIAWDRTRRLADPLLNMAEGKKGKAALGGWQYLLEDEIEQDAGAVWTSLVVKPLELLAQEGVIAAGSKGTPGQRHAKEGKKLIQYLADEFPITKEDPALQDWLKSKKSAHPVQF